MTYCIGMLLDEGILMVADTRTNAGIDRVSTYPKLFTFENTKERVVMLSTSGNLATSQRVISLIKQQIARDEPTNLYNCDSMFEFAEQVGQMLAETVKHYRESNPGSMVSFSSDFILAGQIKGQPPELYQIYPEGNFISSSRDTPFFQIGESKYGKPILDRIIRMNTPLNQAMKCALISFDSTMHSNMSVGMPLDMVVYKANNLTVKIERLPAEDPYFIDLARAWGGGLRSLFEQLP
jgi:putative proteasome-type protease